MSGSTQLRGSILQGPENKANVARLHKQL
jgi:hypothetical protein